MKRPQTKFHTDTMSLLVKKSKNISLSPNFRVAEFFSLLIFC